MSVEKKAGETVGQMAVSWVEMLVCPLAELLVVM
jgi:hypothetical protein